MYYGFSYILRQMVASTAQVSFLILKSNRLFWKIFGIVEMTSMLIFWAVSFLINDTECEDYEYVSEKVRALSNLA